MVGSSVIRDTKGSAMSFLDKAKNAARNLDKDKLHEADA